MGKANTKFAYIESYRTSLKMLLRSLFIGIALWLPDILFASSNQSPESLDFHKSLSHRPWVATTIKTQDDYSALTAWHKAMALAALKYYRNHPADSERWMAIAVGYASANQYARAVRLYRSTGRRRDVHEYCLVDPASVDAFVGSAQYREITREALSVFESSEASVYARVLVTYTKVHALKDVEHPISYYDIYRRRGDIGQMDTLVRTVASWLGKLERCTRDVELDPNDQRVRLADRLMTSAYSEYMQMLRDVRTGDFELLQLVRTSQSRFLETGRKAAAEFKSLAKEKRQKMEALFLEYPWTDSAVPGMSDSTINWQSKLSEPVSTRFLRDTSAIIPFESEWQFLEPSATIVEGWQLSVDSGGGWQTGVGEFGYGDNDENTLVGKRGDDVLPSVHFRREFHLPTTLPDEAIYCAIRYDDGVCLYVNGREVRRLNLPAGNLTESTWAVGVNGQETDAEVIVPRNYLKPGRNIIAISVYQNSARSSDLTFDLQLRYGRNQKFIEKHSSGGRWSDGPYVMKYEGGWKAWTAVATESETRKQEAFVTTDAHALVTAVANRPSFQVELRGVGEIEPDFEEFSSGQQTFVIADTHGEYEVATELLLRHGVINDRMEWAYGSGRLVVLGDVLDRGEHQTELMWLFYNLDNQAKKVGGRLTFVLGNHETMVLRGNISYLHPRYLQAVEAFGVGSYAVLWDENSLLGGWLRRKPAVVKIGKVLFLHGGIADRAVQDNLGISTMNEKVRELLNAPLGSSVSVHPFILGEQGPLWYRGLVRKNSKPDSVEAIKKFYDVERIAVGHTVVPTVTPRYNGSVIAVQVYPTKDKTTGKMNMEGVYIDEQGVWHKAKIDGSREILRDDAGNPIRNGVPTPAGGAGEKTKPAGDEKHAETKKAA